ncbi:nicotinamide N-methyltransferase [Drechmeria coniospora]|uniref:Nicotinamide N-methyltransferase n=1 Tax=Drechmeria coniospora TaxID=98403 RepID=A0A151GRK9_DRECN|nr:nicotinamide N-methyltransferase [Drechmeria coniospora]KYK59642.1 nicotinamide N-methyltransferase [Drechmeria coniospora]
MALTSRICLHGSEPWGPEDYLSTSLGVIYPNDVTNQHGDAEHSLIYTSPNLPRPLALELAVTESEAERRLFSHHLWNSSLLLAELVERDTLGVEDADRDGDFGLGEGASFHVGGQAVLELGAGTALPSIMAGILGARRVVVTDYPAPPILSSLRSNVEHNIRPSFAPAGSSATPAASILVQGHSWGELSDAFCLSNRHAFDRIFVADCLWMPWEHANLLRSIEHFISVDNEDARCWLVAGFHTGREKIRGFFEEKTLREVGLELERIWERDCDGQERVWMSHRPEDDITVRKRWLLVAVLRRTTVNACTS